MSSLEARYKEIQTYCGDKRDYLLEQAINSLKKKGCQVSLVGSFEEAINSITAIVKAGPVVTDSSPLLEKIGVSAQLRDGGFEVIRTDLAGFAGFPGKAEGISQSELQAGLEKVLGVKGSLEELMERARLAIRENLAKAPFGITGADAVIAAHGSLMFVENEGNVRAVSNLPYTHIAVAGVDSIVPDLPDAMTVGRWLSSKRTGQLSRYISITTGPSSTSDIEGRNVKGMHGPKELHVILVENDTF